MSEATNMYPNLNDQQHFRLNRVNEIKDYFKRRRINELKA